MGLSRDEIYRLYQRVLYCQNDVVHCKRFPRKSQPLSGMICRCHTPKFTQTGPLKRRPIGCPKNVGKKLPPYAAQYPRQCTPHVWLSTVCKQLLHKTSCKSKKRFSCWYQVTGRRTNGGREGVPTLDALSFTSWATPKSLPTQTKNNRVKKLKHHVRTKPYENIQRLAAYTLSSVRHWTK